MDLNFLGDRDLSHKNHYWRWKMWWNEIHLNSHHLLWFIFNDKYKSRIVKVYSLDRPNLKLVVLCLENSNCAILNYVLLYIAHLHFQVVMSSTTIKFDKLGLYNFLVLVTFYILLFGQTRWISISIIMFFCPFIFLRYM